MHNTEEEALEHIQLDDYYIDDDDDDYYFSDTPGPSTTTTGGFNSGELPECAFDTMDVVKIEDEDDVRKECHRLRNTKRA
jgi:hypothetical protein